MRGVYLSWGLEDFARVRARSSRRRTSPRTIHGSCRPDYRGHKCWVNTGLRQPRQVPNSSAEPYRPVHDGRGRSRHVEGHGVTSAARSLVEVAAPSLLSLLPAPFRSSRFHPNREVKASLGGRPFALFIPGAQWPPRASIACISARRSSRGRLFQ
jgi:hypothetical protein